MDYNKTINLPQTEFPMRVGLPKRGAGDNSAGMTWTWHNELLRERGSCLKMTVSLLASPMGFATLFHFGEPPLPHSIRLKSHKPDLLLPEFFCDPRNA